MIDPEKLLRLEIPSVVQRYDERDCVIYALSLGFGDSPLDPDHLAFVLAEAPRVVPTLASTLAHPGFWSRDLPTGIDHTKVVHGEEALEIHEPVPASGELVSQSRIVELIDRGPGRGALARVRRELFEKESGRHIASVTSTSFCRADGGFSKAPADPVSTAWSRPQSEPDQKMLIRTLPQAAIIFRLNGDTNRLHVDPGMARSAGFERPILHGLATFGMAGRALLLGPCGGDPERLRAISVRFRAPVYPGETLQFDLWTEEERVLFEARSVERDVVVLDRGEARVANSRKSLEI